MEPEPRQINLTRGVAWSETWGFRDDEDAEVDLTGCTGELLISASAAGGTLATGTWTPTDTTGEALLELTDEQVDEMAAHRVGHWRLVITDTLGTEHEARGPVFMLD
jgi:hypothetical protein